ncbi:hypothetical protein [Desulfoplanes sp.]
MHTDSSMMIHFPTMHPELVADVFPASIRFMDPGHVGPGSDPQGRYFRSENLVYQDRIASKFLEDSLAFGNQFKNVSDAAYFQAGKMDDFFSGSMQEIKSEILSPKKDDSGEEKKKLADAQLLLLLGFHLEEQMLGLGALQNKIDTSVRDFEKNLGMSDEDQCGFGPDFCRKDQGDLPGPTMDWHRLVLPFLRCMPEKAGLVVSDILILAAMQNHGLEPTAVPEDNMAALFPDWEPSVSVACTMDHMTAGMLGEYAGVKVPADLQAKEIVLVGLTRN